MTSEEAIKIIDCYDIGFYDLSGEKIPADKLADAFDMAIEALQTPPISQRSMYQAGYRQGQKDRPRGEWLDTEFEKLKRCSRCSTEWGIYSIEEFDFCPSCGADMRPTERSEE